MNAVKLCIGMKDEKRQKVKFHAEHQNGRGVIQSSCDYMLTFGSVFVQPVLLIVIH